MPLNLTVISNEHANEVSSEDPWLLLLSVEVPATAVLPATTLYVAHNNEDVVYQGNTYEAFAFDFPGLDQKPGELPNFEMRISNVSKLAHSLLEQYNGASGATATFFVVSAKDINGSSPAQIWTFDVYSAHANDQWATIVLSSFSPMRLPFPSLLYYADFCPYMYNSPARQAMLDPVGCACGYGGQNPLCDHNLNGANGCVAHGNTSRFGGFPGLISKGYQNASIV